MGDQIRNVVPEVVRDKAFALENSLKAWMECFLLGLTSLKILRAINTIDIDTSLVKVNAVAPLYMFWQMIMACTSFFHHWSWSLY